MPVGYDGLLLPEVYLTADVQYEIPYTKKVSFSQNINKEDYADDEAYQAALISDLREQGQAYLDENSVPRVNYTLRANVEKLTDIGDTVEVIDETFKSGSFNNNRQRKIRSGCSRYLSTRAGIRKFQENDLRPDLTDWTGDERSGRECDDRDKGDPPDGTGSGDGLDHGRDGEFIRHL